MTVRQFLAGGALLVLLAGCNSGPGGEEPSAGPTPAPSVTATEANPPSEDDSGWEAPDPAAWRLVLDTDFEGPAMPENWDYRMTDVYDAGGRWCAAPVEKNVQFEDGVVGLAVSKASKKVTTRVNADAKTKQAEAKKKVVGCPDGVFGNAMISTQHLFTVGTGMVAARLKFPVEQGAHASVWLQSYANQEIDIIETYGFGRDATSVAHVDGKRVPADGADTYVATDRTADRGWWDEWHVASVEWTQSEIIFRLDGEVTQELKQETVPTDYFLILSMLSSDWETYRLTEPGVRKGSTVDPGEVELPTLPFAMQVDWVRVWEPA